MLAAFLQQASAFWSEGNDVSKFSRVAQVRSACIYLPWGFTQKGEYMAYVDQENNL